MTNRCGSRPICELVNSFISRLTFFPTGLKIPPIPPRMPPREIGAHRPELMNPPRPQQPPAIKAIAPCKHPQVKVVAREDDAEFVECLECGEVFESSEFRDMDIEETKLEEG